MPIIRLPEGAPQDYDDSTIELTDDRPFIDIGLAAQPSREHAIGLEKLPDDHQDDLLWYRWYVLGSKDPSRIRKTGAFSLELRGQGSILRAYLFSARVLTREQHQRMLADIERFSPSALWDHPEQQAGRLLVEPDGAARTDRKTEVVSLVARLAEEAAIAESALLGLAWELAPPRPGAPHLATRDHGRYFDLNENRAILHWARRRLRDIEQSAAACAAALAAMQTEAETLRTLSSDRAREHLQHVTQDISAIEKIHASLRAAGSRVMRIHRQLRERGVSDAPWQVTPSITRNPYIAPLVGRSAEAPQRIHNAEVKATRLSLLAQRLSCRIYEVWVALAVAQLLTAIGCAESEPPQINFSSEIDAIRTKYAQKILWIDEAGRSTHCSLAPSFAICPNVPEELKASIRKHASEYQVLALELAPWSAAPPPAALELIASILATLEWSCRRSP